MFETDAQTLTDLQLFPAKKGESSVFDLLNSTQSYGGKIALDSMLRHPLPDAEAIRRQVELLKYLETGGERVRVEAEALDFVEHYLRLRNVPTRCSRWESLRKHWRQYLQPDNDYYIVTRAIGWLAEIVADLHAFASASGEKRPAGLCEMSERILEITALSGFAEIKERKVGKKFSAFEIERLDHLLRYQHKDRTRELLDMLYRIDAFQAILRAKAAHGLTFAETAQEGPMVEIEGLWHPFIKECVANDITLSPQSNAGFITGANMAGKSTFMRAFGLALYLARAGLPVPARRMRCSVFDGILSTINIADNLSLGYSHFYAEVQRIKAVAEQVTSPGRYVVIFDELFRGTNVKDASEATVAIIRAFSGILDSLFLFSSHILEAAEELGSSIPGLQFFYFQTDMQGETLTYPYRLQPGISDDRFGMYIIRRERILEQLAAARSQKG